jgi:osmotically-inducible protein OsmY
MSELKLRDDILDELAYEPIVDPAHIGVAVDQDVVTLTGHVASYAQKLAAISAVRRVKGVHGIADEIEVRYSSDERTSDDEIAKRVINVLSWDSVIPSNAIQVTVRDGLVILTGKVNWYYQKSSAERDVRGLSGVRSVVNNIEIEPHARPEDARRRSKRPCGATPKSKPRTYASPSETMMKSCSKARFATGMRNLRSKMRPGRRLASKMSRTS